MLFWSQRREAGFLKIVLPLEREHDFRGSGGSKIDQNRVRKQLPAESGLKDRLRGLLGSILEAFGDHFGWDPKSVQKGIGKLVEF